MEEGGVVANMHSEHVRKHHVTHQARDNKHRDFHFQKFPRACGCDSPVACSKRPSSWVGEGCPREVMP